jgi:hypothetical protein
MFLKPCFIPSVKYSVFLHAGNIERREWNNTFSNTEMLWHNGMNSIKINFHDEGFGTQHNPIFLPFSMVAVYVSRLCVTVKWLPPKAQLTVVLLWWDYLLCSSSDWMQSIVANLRRCMYTSCFSRVRPVGGSQHFTLVPIEKRCASRETSHFWTCTTVCFFTRTSCSVWKVLRVYVCLGREKTVVVLFTALK